MCKNANMRNWVFVKVETDQPGLHGWGEATLEWKTESVVGAIHDVSHYLLGEDPFRIEHLYQIMTRISAAALWRACMRARHRRSSRSVRSS